MIGTVVAEFEASAIATLGAKISAVAAQHGVSLTSTFTVDPWYEIEAEENQSFPALAVRWIRTRTGDGKKYSGRRDSEHEIGLLYAFKSTSLSEIGRHMMYIPEALLLWLDDFPTSGTTPGKTISQVAPPDGQQIEIEHELESAYEDRDDHTTTYLWVASMTLAVRARDTI